MCITGKLHTAKEKHSLVEAFLSIGIQGEIPSFEEIQKLLVGGNFNSMFEKVEPVRNMVSLTSPTEGNNSSQELPNSATRGFKIIGFNNGRAERYIQLNPIGPSNAVLSFHTTDYIRWDDFKSQLKEDIEAIARILGSSNVSFFATSFIDSFFYDKSEDYDGKALFNIHSTRLSEDAISQNLMDFKQIMKKEKGNRTYQDNLSVSVYDRDDSKRIEIISNITFPIEPEQFSELISEDDFYDTLDFAHNENKTMLRDILNEEIIKIIKL